MVLQILRVNQHFAFGWPFRSLLCLDFLNSYFQRRNPGTKANTSFLQHHSACSVEAFSYADAPSPLLVEGEGEAAQVFTP